MKFFLWSIAHGLNSPKSATHMCMVGWVAFPKLQPFISSEYYMSFKRKLLLQQRACDSKSDIIKITLFSWITKNHYHQLMRAFKKHQHLINKTTQKFSATLKFLKHQQERIGKKNRTLRFGDNSSYHSLICLIFT